jgi:hypothetical protein
MILIYFTLLLSLIGSLVWGQQLASLQELTGVYDTTESYVALGQTFDEALSGIADGSLNVSEAEDSFVRSNASVVLSILLVDEASQIFAGLKRANVPGLDLPKVDRIMGRAKAIGEDTIQISFQESTDTSTWDGVVFVSNGTMMVERIEGLEVVSSDGVVIDNQATSYFVFQKSKDPFDIVQEAKGYQQDRRSADGVVATSSGGACTCKGAKFGMQIMGFLFFLAPMYAF